MRRLLIVLNILFCSFRLYAQTEKFMPDDLGIMVEKFDSTNVDANRFNHNNKIYKVGRKFTFTYYYEDKNGVRQLMTKGALNQQNNYDWKFERQDKKDNNSVVKIILSVNAGLSPFIEQMPDYNQTVVTYDFKLLNGESWNNEMTGVIENEKNVWMHPPRTDFFKILELNPFPYIKAPFIVGNKWDWQLKFGKHWADKRWLVWEGENENIYHYEITRKLLLPTTLGKITCFEVKSTAKSNLGQTKLIAYFNVEYGFVKFDYTNIDGTKTVIEIEKVE